MIFLIVAFGEVLPMTIAVDNPLRFGRLAAWPILGLAWVLTPVRAVLGAFTALVSRAVAREETPQTAITEAELRTLVEVGTREGVVERTEREMIHGVFELGDTTVWDLMTPRTDVFGIELGTPPERLLGELRAAPAPPGPGLRREPGQRRRHPVGEGAAAVLSRASRPASTSGGT